MGVILTERVTEWLRLWGSGDEEALRHLTPLVYSELRLMAARYLRRERGTHTLQATALVHEAYLHIRRLDRVQWKDRAHFIAMAACIMRQILVDHARKRLAEKRGGLDGIAISPPNMDDFAAEPEPDLVALDDALQELAKTYPRQARVVELKVFGGLTAEEIAGVLEGPLTTRTIERDWRFARAWLQKAMSSV